MLTVASERIREEGLNNIKLIEVDTEELDFPDGEFDGAVCRWGLMFLSNLNAGLERIHKSLKPGAKFAATVWATPDQVPVASLPMAVAQEVLKAQLPPPPDAPDLFSLGGDGILQSAMQAAGFKNVEVESRKVLFELESPQEYSELLSDLIPPIRAMRADRPSDQIEHFWSAVASRAAVFVNDKGNFAIPNTAPLAIGTK